MHKARESEGTALLFNVSLFEVRLFNEFLIPQLFAKLSLLFLRESIK